VFNKLTVDAVLQESKLRENLSKSWIREDQFSLLICSENPSAFTLRRMASGQEAALSAVRGPFAKLGARRQSATDGCWGNLLRILQRRPQRFG